jgi:hypothetical protein
MFRFTFPPFDDILHTYATIFTFCYLLSFADYCGNVSPAPKMSSELLKIVGKAALMHSGIVKMFALRTSKNTMRSSKMTLSSENRWRF